LALERSPALGTAGPVAPRQELQELPAGCKPLTPRFFPDAHPLFPISQIDLQQLHLLDDPSLADAWVLSSHGLLSEVRKQVTKA
jgi:hypothetical protein